METKFDLKQIMQDLLNSKIPALQDLLHFDDIECDDSMSKAGHCLNADHLVDDPGDVAVTKTSCNSTMEMMEQCSRVTMEQHSENTMKQYFDSQQSDEDIGELLESSESTSLADTSSQLSVCSRSDGSIWEVNSQVHLVIIMMMLDVIYKTVNCR